MFTLKQFEHKSQCCQRVFSPIPSTTKRNAKWVRSVIAVLSRSLIYVFDEFILHQDTSLRNKYASFTLQRPQWLESYMCIVCIHYFIIFENSIRFSCAVYIWWISSSNRWKLDRKQICLIKVKTSAVDIRSIKMSHGKKCNICSAIFYNMDAAWKHYTDVHIKKQYVCSRCPEEYSELISFNSHWLIAHNDVPNMNYFTRNIEMVR